MSDLAKAILKKPYRWILIPEEAGGFTSAIYEFPGCLSEGETVEKAVANLLEAAEGWIDAAIAADQEIPPPLDETQSIWG